MLQVFLILFGILSLAVLLVWVVLPFFKVNADYPELKLRIRSWVVIFAILTLAVTTTRNLSILFFMFLSFLALKEFFSLINTDLMPRGALIWAYLAIPVQYYWIYNDWYRMFIVFVPVYVFLLLPVRMVIGQQTEGFLNTVATLQWGVMLNVFCIGHLACLAIFGGPYNPNGGGQGLILFVIMLTELNDIAQYIWGKMFGKHKITPKVSPNKTVEGFLGGVVTTTVLSCAFAHFLTPFTMKQAVLAGIILSCGGFLGDVIVSALKRDIGVKDTGNLIPGHGGVLDRIDSLTYNAPLFFHFFWYLYKTNL